jgi:mannose-6-phosphate isomerase-like protein (cupin superfamily)
MQTFDLATLVADREKLGRPWLEFLHTASLSMGVYHLKAGQADRQNPHTEDEVYYVLSGQAVFWTAQESKPVGPGAILYVDRKIEHRFMEISEDLMVLVFFAPPEGSLQGN